RTGISAATNVSKVFCSFLFTRPLTLYITNKWTERNQHYITQAKPRTENISPCRPKNRFVFIKIPKTGSSTVGTMLERYGYRRDLHFAVPKIPSHSFPMGRRYRFADPALVFQWNLTDRGGVPVWPALGGFHILVNHARYNRSLLEALIPRAVYFTIIREPGARSESFFRYFLYQQKVPHTANEDPLEVFMRDPHVRSRAIITRYKWNTHFRNGQMFMLGLNPGAYDNTTAVEAVIGFLSQSMDLVMLNEYFDESLLLLKRLMCWDFQDIVYISKAVGRATQNRTGISADLRDKLRSWNGADNALYRHFNRTFWGKVRSYGPGFGQDLETFRALKESTTRACMAQGSRVWDWHNSSYWQMPANASRKCQDLVRDDKAWVKLIRSRMQAKSKNFIKYRNEFN
ncbi:galactosylceramide sulfotransferase-like, partial [Acanthaster planci]|uniref:Galactosylceramide sulfotransferase-like n=1 Tax=Acanthaster planci TaxID=133434 RepID=A0A8B7YZR2_ACAPL